MSGEAPKPEGGASRHSVAAIIKAPLSLLRKGRRHHASKDDVQREHLSLTNRERRILDQMERGEVQSPIHGRSLGSEDSGLAAHRTLHRRGGGEEMDVDPPAKETQRHEEHHGERHSSGPSIGHGGARQPVFSAKEQEEMRDRLRERLSRVAYATMPYEAHTDIMRQRQLERSRRLTEEHRAQIDRMAMQHSLEHQAEPRPQQHTEHGTAEQRSEAESEKHHHGKRPKPEEQAADQEPKKTKLSRRATQGPRPLLQPRSPVSGADDMDVDSPHSSGSSEPDGTAEKVSKAEARL